MPRLWVREVLSLQTASLADLFGAYHFLLFQIQELEASNTDEKTLIADTRQRLEAIYSEIDRRVDYLTTQTIKA